MKATTSTIILSLVLFALGGCSTYFAVTDQQELAATNTVISGTVLSEDNFQGPIIVGLLEETEQGLRLVDHFVSISPGRWIFAVEPGTYQLAAFADLNANGNYDNEPALAPADGIAVTVQPGETMADIHLDIPADGRFKEKQFSMKEIAARNPSDQQRISLFSLCNIGEVTTLDDPRFVRENAQAGMWKFYDFLLADRCGVYFLQTYDPDRIPVLFVHGIMGTPLDFEAIIGNLDTTRFQPWVFYYPSGATLENASALLLQLLTRLKLDYQFNDLYVVAHSMGGLVARDFVLLASEGTRGGVIKKFVTISSPLGGMPSAGKGVDHSPVVVSSWRGLDPDGSFLDALFYKDVEGSRERRRIPDSISYHMLFGYKGDSGDGIVPIASELRQEAQEEAESIRGFEEDHTSILRSEEAIRHLNRVLAN